MEQAESILIGDSIRVEDCNVFIPEGTIVSSYIRINGEYTVNAPIELSAALSRVRELEHHNSELLAKVAHLEALVPNPMSMYDMSGSSLFGLKMPGWDASGSQLLRASQAEPTSDLSDDD